jgi:N-acetylmuramate 1-kinase
MTNDTRLDQLESWLKKELKFDNFSLEPASEDASFRRYFRITKDQQTWIAMDAPPEKEDCEPFIKVATMIEEAKVQAPHIFNYNKKDGYLLLSDLGSQPYLDKLNNESSNSLYTDAINALINMQTINKKLADYDDKLLRVEMNLFSDWYLSKHLNITLNNTQKNTLSQCYDLLSSNALEQTQTFVHRDYHSRNLMVTEINNPGVIDFQDAVLGPITYDLASLLKDCYIAWPRESIENWINYFIQSSPLCADIDQQKFIKWFDLMGMQRHLKAVGIFARLNHRDGKPNYLHDIPRTLTYIFDVCSRYNELNAFGQLLSDLNLKPDTDILKQIQ